MTARATSIDRRGLARGRTEDVEAIERPLAEWGEANVPLAPGRYLLVEQGAAMRAIALTRQITHLGRGFAATVQLEDAGVSRRHAIIVQRRGAVRILDDRSANGTWVNGRRVFEAELHDGDAIVLGRALLVYRERPAQAA
ncbi:MAG TPA: FHA domain-containing protein [Conexibacter sp.]|nr:FHA domain-containing protein [Conexibacter sp.]